MKITRAEQETIINFDEEGKEAYVYTYKPAYIRLLEKLCAEHPEEFKKERVDHGGHNYIIPKKYIKIGKPVKLGEAHKEKLREGLRNFKAQQEG